jgi:hypothetical protein
MLSVSVAIRMEDHNAATDLAGELEDGGYVIEPLRSLAGGNWEVVLKSDSITGPRASVFLLGLGRFMASTSYTVPARNPVKQ